MTETILQLEFRENRAGHRLAVMNVPLQKRDEIWNHLHQLTTADNISEVKSDSQLSYFVFGLYVLPEAFPFQKILGPDLVIRKIGYQDTQINLLEGIAHFKKLSFERQYRFRENAEEKTYLFKKLSADHYVSLNEKINNSYRNLKDRGTGSPNMASFILLKEILDEECLLFKKMIDEQSISFELMANEARAHFEAISRNEAMFKVPLKKEHESPINKIIHLEVLSFEKLISGECHRFKEMIDDDYYRFKALAEGDYYHLKNLIGMSN